MKKSKLSQITQHGVQSKDGRRTGRIIREATPMDSVGKKLQMLEKWSASLWFLQFSEMPPIQPLYLFYYLNAEFEEAMVEEATWLRWRETLWYTSEDKLSILSLVAKASCFSKAEGEIHQAFQCLCLESDCNYLTSVVPSLISGDGY